MATRFRLTANATAPAVSPAQQTYTHNQATRRQLLTTDSSALTTSAYTPDGADHLVAGDAMHIQFVSDPMQSGIAFTNANTIKGCVQLFEANAANNLRQQLWVGIYSQDGATLRRALIAKTLGGAAEMGTALSSDFFTTTQSGATYTTVSGDRLVVEYSVSGTPTAAGGVQGHNASIRWGGNGAGGDLLENNTQTGTTLNPWIEFVPTITFLNPQLVVPGKASLTLTAQTPTVALSDNKVAVPGKASLTLAAQTPTVTVSSGTLVVPGTAALVLTAKVPAAVVNTNVIPGVKALTLAAQTPTVLTPRTVVPGVATLGLAAQTAVVQVGVKLTPGVAALTLSPLVATVATTNNVLLVPGTTALTTARYAPTVTGSGSGARRYSYTISIGLGGPATS